MTPAPTHRRFRWSLRTMFVVVTVLCVAIAFGPPYWTWFVAVRRHQQVASAYDTECCTWDQLCEASERLLKAELHLPISDKLAARRRHIQCLTALIEEYDFISKNGATSGDDPGKLVSHLREMKANAMADLRRAEQE